jgi:hypothetical protein
MTNGARYAPDSRILTTAKDCRRRRVAYTQTVALGHPHQATVIGLPEG